MANSYTIKTLHIEEMEDGGPMRAAVKDDDQYIMVVEQGDDSVWLDRDGARALAAFLMEWADE